jgi:hypothetical protein
MSDYFKKTMATRHSFVATICDPRFKFSVLAWLFEADEGEDSIQYKKGKAHFEHVYSAYKTRSVGLVERERIRAENAAIDAAEAREIRSVSPELEGEEDWRVNLFYSYADHMARQQRLPPGPIQTEIQRWHTEPVIDPESTPEEIRVYLQS